MSQEECIHWEIITTKLRDLPQRKILEREHINQCDICWKANQAKTNQITEAIHRALDPIPLPDDWDSPSDLPHVGLKK
ncbi:MAG: hypothetical protein M3Q07_06420 [Pseudobdellovibrionaceae bacterium]|nr:hypothetical protein [Pseudobdellovibrionaceae bacterium]